MITIIEYLTAIREYAKEIHYRTHGKEFYGIHLLMDRVADGIYDTIDQIKEVYYLGSSNEPPLTSEILKNAADRIPGVTSSTEQNLKNLLELIEITVAHAQTLNQQLQTRATNALLDSISENLQLKQGLIWKSL
jgi:DNA-binding ferritin-like protein